MISLKNADNIPYYPDLNLYHITENDRVIDYIVTKVRIKRDDKWYVIVALQSFEASDKCNILYHHRALHRNVYDIIYRYIVKDTDIDKLDILQIDEETRLSIIDTIVNGEHTQASTIDIILNDEHIYSKLLYYKGLHQNRSII